MRYCQRCGVAFGMAFSHAALGALCPVCLRPLLPPLARPSSTLRKLYDRDHGVCWLCRAPVDRGLMGQVGPGAPTRDHVVPRSRGGGDGLGNLRLAHSWCNLMRSRRGDVAGDGRPVMLTAAQVAQAHRMFGGGTSSSQWIMSIPASGEAPVAWPSQVPPPPGLSPLLCPAPA